MIEFIMLAGLVFILVVYGIIIYSTMKIAEKKGYDKVVAVLVGLFLNIGGLLIYALLPDKKDNKK